MDVGSLRHSWKGPKIMSQEAEDKVINTAGTPRQDHVYAVFANEVGAETAARALAEQGVELTLLRGQESAQALLVTANDSTLLATAARFLKRLGGETHEAERYAEHLEKGRVVAAAPVRDRDAAGVVTAVLLAHGAYDITHFGAWAIEHTSWEEDASRGKPTFTTTNTGDSG
jgi:hypothetical protein